MNCFDYESKTTYFLFTKKLKVPKGKSIIVHLALRFVSSSDIFL